MHASPWYGLSFASKVEVTCGTIVCAKSLTESLLQIITYIYILIAEAIHYALASDPSVEVMGPLSAENTGINVICAWKRIYLLALYIKILLVRDIFPIKAWTRFQGAIVDENTKAYSEPIINWIQVALTRKSRYYQPPLMDMPRPTTTLMDGGREAQITLLHSL